MGSRGIPNYYGGFEQFAQYLSAGLQQRGHEVFVYNSHRPPSFYHVEATLPVTTAIQEVHHHPVGHTCIS